MQVYFSFRSFSAMSDMVRIIQHNWSLIHIITKRQTSQATEQQSKEKKNKNQFVWKMKFIAFKLTCSSLEKCYSRFRHHRCHNFIFQSIMWRWRSIKFTMQIFSISHFNTFILISLMTHCFVSHSTKLCQAWKKVLFLIYFLSYSINYALWLLSCWIFFEKWNITIILRWVVYSFKINYFTFNLIRKLFVTFYSIDSFFVRLS